MNANLLYTDTDSLILEVFTDDIYNDIKADLHMFDTSNFETDNIYNLPRVNKKVPGKFKFETGSKIIAEFVGLRAKLYTFRLQSQDNECLKKAKGIKASVVNKLKFDDYLNCLNSNEILMCQMCVFRTIKHDVFVQKVNKIGLSASDDKRFIIPDTHDTLSWGHHRIP